MERIIIRLAFVGLILAIGQLDGFGQQATNQPAGIKTNFLADSQLSGDEVKQVLALAKECGLKDAAEVSTGRALPGDTRVISVKSVDHVDGRNTWFETILIIKDSWHSGFIPQGKVKRVGDFWSKSDYRSKTCLRSYEFRKKKLQIAIEEGVDFDLADKAISLIEEGKVQFKFDSDHIYFEQLKDAEPSSIAKGDRRKEYELRYHGNMSSRVLIFRFEQNEVIFVSVGHEVI